MAINKIRTDTSGNCKEVARHPPCIIYIGRSAKLLPVHDITYSRVLEDVLISRTSWVVRSSQIALVESAHLVGTESSNNGMQDASVMEQNHIALFPIVRVHEL